MKVAEAHADSRSLWVGVAAEADLVFLPAANDVCLVNPNTGAPINTAGYACVDPGSGTAFPANRQTDQATLGSGDQVVGGLKSTNVRLLASVDYALSHNVLVGARGGYVLRTPPTPNFGRRHLEARLTYAIGHDALTREGLSPIVLVGVGAGEFDGYVPVLVSVGTQSRIIHATENAWLTSRPFFMTVGGVGARRWSDPGWR